MLYIFYLIDIIIASQDKLLNVQAIWRHGARNYYHCNWKCIEDQPRGDAALLTPTGMRQQYVLGQWIRQRYIIDNTFLASTFNENEIYIESSDVNRTLQSAYSQLQGMYPEGLEVPTELSKDKLLPPNPGSLHPDIGNFALPNKIQLIPIHTKEKSIDYAIALSCPGISNQKEQNKNTVLYKKINEAEKTKQLYSDFNKALAETDNFQDVTDFIQLSEYRDTFICNRYNNDELPPKLNADTLNEMDKIANLAFSLQIAQTWEQSKRYSTPYFKQLIDQFDSYLNGSTKFKYRGSSAHDSTLLTILSALNLTSADCQAKIYLNEESDAINCQTEYVEFASNIIFELFSNTVTGPYVKVLYNGVYQPICSPYGKTCNYQRFRSIILAQQVNYQEECKLPIDTIEIDEQAPGWAIAFFVIVTILAVGAVGVIFLIKSKLKKVSFNDDDV